jgi:type II secretory pathway component PulC
VAGVLESRNPGASRALLRDAAARSCTVVMGGQLEGYAVVEIADRRVVLERDGQRVVLSPGAPTGLQSAAATTTPLSRLRALVHEREAGVFEADRRALQAALGESMGELLVTAQLIPAFEGGRATGLKLANLREGSPLSWLGLQRSDVITSVGGIALTSADAMLAALPAMQRAPVIEVAWVRAGRPMQARLELTERSPR